MTELSTTIPRHWLRCTLPLFVALTTACTPNKPVDSDPTATPRAQGPTASAARFADHLPEALCGAFLSCKNQEVQQAALIQGMFSMATASKHAAQVIDTEVQPALAALPNGFIENREQCLPIARAIAKGYGYAPGIVRPKAGVGLVTFDPDAAAACIDGIRNPPAECADELRVTDPAVVAEGARRHTSEAYFAPLFTACGDAITGTLQPGETCEYHYECEGDRARCNVVDELCYAR